jgi:glycosyltransferase involved in cell wall biosynthesis
MRFLINASKEKAGGGLQVTDSICKSLNHFPQHHFHVVLSDRLLKTSDIIRNFPNVTVYIHTFKDSVKTLASGRYAFLDNLVEEFYIDAVLTVFGPSRWAPKVPHLCGFARAQLLMPESPYLQMMTRIQRVREKILNWFVKRYFNPSKVKIFYSENRMISDRVENLFPGSKCYTITNYYNQVFDCPEQWKIRQLPHFDGVTLLTIATFYPHKNLKISIGISRYFKEKYPDFRFRFVFSVDEKDFGVVPEDLKEHFCFIGTVDISECPSLYQQCDIAFQPTLIECFTASYPEAMRMERPIVTTDMAFAKGLCEDAAAYYSAMDAESSAETIYKVATDKEYAASLVEAGKEQLKKYDDYNSRVCKIINILESLAS